MAQARKTGSLCPLAGSLMNQSTCLFRTSWVVRGGCTLFAAGLALISMAPPDSFASPPWGGPENTCAVPGCPAGGPPAGILEGAWYWLRSPEEERRVTMGLYNRFCVRCHGVDGRGVWDIPSIPDFTNTSWQACRTDPQIVRAILEGRRWCMPPFRSALSSEEAWSMAHYLRTFVPGTELSRPDTSGSQPRQAPNLPPKSS